MFGCIAKLYVNRCAPNVTHIERKRFVALINMMQVIEPPYVVNSKIFKNGTFSCFISKLVLHTNVRQIIVWKSPTTFFDALDFYV